MSDDNEIIRTRVEKGHDEFERIASRQATLSERAAATAALSRRDPSTSIQEARHLVRVVAVERDGHDAFFRAGHRWPSDPNGRVALVTRRLLAALKSERHLRVDENPVDLDPEASYETLDVPVRESVDLSAVLAAQQVPAPAVASEALRAAFEAGRLAAENDSLREQLAELRAASGGNAAPPAPPAGGDDDGKASKGKSAK